MRDEARSRPTFPPYGWAPSTEELARRVGLDPVEIVRFDGNVPALPLAARASRRRSPARSPGEQYPHGGYPELLDAIAEYAGVEPENVVLGAGADDLILLCARAFAGPGDTVASPRSRRTRSTAIAAGLAGAEVGDDDPVVTFCCRPNNPTGALGPLPAARPLVVDEAYYEYAGETAVGLIDDGVIVLRTFSKAFGLAGARVGYALADEDTAAELNARQAPRPVSTLSAALASPRSGRRPTYAVVEERERLAPGCARSARPVPSRANSSSCRSTSRASSATPARQGLVVRVRRRHPHLPSATARTTTCSLEALARALDGRRRWRQPGTRVRHAAGDRRDAHRRAARARRRRPRSRRNGRRAVRPPARAARVPRRPRPRRRRRRRLGDGAHHTAEDTAIALGEALDRALGDRRGIARYGDAVVPMDDALARAAVDLGGRRARRDRPRARPGLARARAREPRAVRAHRAPRRGDRTRRHHVAEAAFKAVGRALRTAVRVEGEGIPSTKGLL